MLPSPKLTGPANIRLPFGDPVCLQAESPHLIKRSAHVKAQANATHCLPRDLYALAHFIKTGRKPRRVGIRFNTACAITARYTFCLRQVRNAIGRNPTKMETEF